MVSFSLSVSGFNFASVLGKISKISSALYPSLCRFVSWAALVLALQPEYRAVTLPSVSITVSTFTSASLSASMFTSLLAFNGRIVTAFLWTYALAYTSLLSHQRSRFHVCMCQVVSTPVPETPHSLMWRRLSRSPTLLPSKPAFAPLARPTHNSLF